MVSNFSSLWALRPVAVTAIIPTDVLQLYVGSCQYYLSYSLDLKSQIWSSSQGTQESSAVTSLSLPENTPKWWCSSNQQGSVSKLTLLYSKIKHMLPLVQEMNSTKWHDAPEAPGTTQPRHKVRYTHDRLTLILSCRTHSRITTGGKWLIRLSCLKYSRPAVINSWIL